MAKSIGPTILYDHQIFESQKYGGISRYFAEIIKHSREYSSELSILFSDNAYINETLELSNTQRIKDGWGICGDKFFPGKGRLIRTVQRIIPDFGKTPFEKNRQNSIKKLCSGNFDLFHPTYYSDYFLPYLNGRPFVLTIHDMIHELYPEQLKDPLLVQQKRNLATKAAHIIAVSENTKKDIIDIMDIPESKISVIYHANSLRLSPTNFHNFPARYMLYVGERAAYKNFVFFIYSIATILRDNKDVHLICTGRHFSEDESAILAQEKISSQVQAISANEGDMTYLYQHALALVFPSYYEGFGIPLLEAFACSCPVLASNSSCFPEIGLDACIYFNPKSSLDIRKKVQNLIEGRYHVLELIEKGKKRSKYFSWNIAAEQTAHVYNNVLATFK